MWLLVVAYWYVSLPNQTAGFRSVPVVKIQRFAHKRECVAAKSTIDRSFQNVDSISKLIGTEAQARTGPAGEINFHSGCVGPD
jgi:hypothetical protein